VTSRYAKKRCAAVQVDAIGFEVAKAVDRAGIGIGIGNGNGHRS